MRQGEDHVSPPTASSAHLSLQEGICEVREKGLAMTAEGAGEDPKGSLQGTSLSKGPEYSPCEPPSRAEQASQCVRI